MVDKTEVDNEGIKKGLQQISLQLNETNKQLAEQGRPNLFKAFKENQAEVFTAISMSLAERKHAEKIADAVSDGVGTVKTPRDAKGRALARKPAEGDTLYGLMAKLVTISADQQTMFENAKSDAEKKQEELQRNQEKKDEEKLQIALKTNAEDRTLNQIVAVDAHADAENAKDVANEERIERRNNSHKFLESLRRGFTGLKNPALAQAKLARDAKKLLGKGLLTRAKVLKRMIKQGKLAEGLGKSFKNFFSKDKKDKKEQAGLISRGLSKLGGIFKSGFNAFKSTFGFLLKTAAALLTIGLIFKFLDSDYWKSIKPNIGNIIAQSVIVAENIVNLLISVIKDVLIPALMTLAKVILFVAKKIGALFGFQFAEGRADEIKKEIDADPSYKSDAEREKAVKDKLAFEKREYMGFYDPVAGPLGMQKFPLVAAARFAFNYLMGNSIEDMRKNNSIAFDTKAGNDGASFQGKQFSFKVPTLNTTIIDASAPTIVNSSNINNNALVLNDIFRELHLSNK